MYSKLKLINSNIFLFILFSLYLFRFRKKTLETKFNSCLIIPRPQVIATKNLECVYSHFPLYM